MHLNFAAYANRFRRFYHRMFQPLTESLGLSQLEIDVLLFLRNNPEHNTARDIASMRGFAKSNVSTAVESLGKKGFLRVEADPSSRRLRRLFLSPAKSGEMAQLGRRQEECLEAVVSNFTWEERDFLRRLLERADENIDARLRELEEGPHAL